VNGIPAVDRVGTVTPVVRRDPAHAPASDEHRPHDRPKARDPHDTPTDPPGDNDLPAVAPAATFGKIIDVFVHSADACRHSA
jgi:hypothetical protein